jgi:indolepyruvate ferredoxin oxidoreductase alpha subunit
VATPQFLYNLHSLLNGKIKDIAKEDAFFPSVTPGDGSFDKCCIISSGVAWAHIFDLLDDMKLSKKIDLFKVDMPFPLNEKFIEKINSEYENVLVVEETYPVIEMQLAKEKVKGRLSGYVPKQGELTPDIIEDILKEFLEIPIEAPETVESEKGVRPSLCPGCPHRAAFFAIRETFPGGIFPSDIGCYTLGMNLGAVDTCHCMGACISQGAGFYHAYAQDGKDFPTIVVTIGDSTFFHAGVPGLINAVFQKARFILVILDNSTTAMTGHQPTPQLGVRANGTEGNPVLIENLVAACGVKFQKECDPYDMNQFISHLKEADRYCRSEDGGVAVIISKHPCLVNKKAKEAQSVYLMNITEDCTGCRKCVEKFECAALVFRQEEKKVIIDQNICVGCGVCRHVCPVSAITAYKKEDGR